MIDIKIKSEEGCFKFRVAGLLKCDDKFLFVKMNKNEFFCLPGGHVELAEDTESAVLREMEEELGFPIKISRYLGNAQNIFIGRDGKKFHELGFYYEVVAENENDINKQDYVRLENDKGFIQNLEFKWFSLEDLKNEDIRPEFVLDMLKSTEPQTIIKDYTK